MSIVIHHNCSFILVAKKYFFLLPQKDYIQRSYSQEKYIYFTYLSKVNWKANMRFWYIFFIHEIEREKKNSFNL